MPTREQTEKAMLGIGRLHESLDRVPLVGELLARGFSRSWRRSRC